MTKRATPELKAAIRRYNTDGWSYYALAKIVPYSEVAIAKWCDNGFKARQAKNSKSWQEGHKEEHRRTVKEWSKKNAKRLSDEKKEARKKEPAGSGPRKRATPELKAAIRRYNRDGWSYYALAKIVPYTKEAIAKWCDNELKTRQDKSSEAWRTSHREYHRQATAKWTTENSEHVKAFRKERYYRELAENPNMNKEAHEKYREKRNAASAAYREANREKMRQLDHDWVRNNPDKNAAKTAKTRAGNACPPWITEEQTQEMLDFYTKAHLRSQETGERHEVDHIHPLKSRKVEACGLHVPWNLQVLLAEDNKKKSDSYVV